jgi:hypothetical protein
MPNRAQRGCAKNQTREELPVGRSKHQQVVWFFRRRLDDLSGGVSVSHQFADVTASLFFSRDPGAQVQQGVGAVRLHDVENGYSRIETPGQAGGNAQSFTRDAPVADRAQNAPD